MTEPVSEVSRADDGAPKHALNCLDCLQPNLVVVDMAVTSRKRLLEQFSQLITNNAVICDPEIVGEVPSSAEIFETLHNRERLGSTALGKGIALPHGRIDSLKEPVIAIAKLETPIDYDAPDGNPVWIAVCLLVPTEANALHLDLLARLATKFSDQSFVHEVQQSNSTTELYNLFSVI